LRDPQRAVFGIHLRGRTVGHQQRRLFVRRLHCRVAATRAVLPSTDKMPEMNHGNMMHPEPGRQALHPETPQRRVQRQGDGTDLAGMDADHAVLRIIDQHLLCQPMRPCLRQTPQKNSQMRPYKPLKKKDFFLGALHLSVYH